MIPPKQQVEDKHFMEQALELAREAFELGEIPVGAVLVRDGITLGSGANRCIVDHDPSAHAEIMALRQAAAVQKNFRLSNTTLYVTLEPCLMCCGALLHSRIARVVYGAREPRSGGVVSLYDSLRLPGLDHHVAITEGVLAEQSIELLQMFFKQRR